MNLNEIIDKFFRKLAQLAKDEGYCMVCQRDAPEGKCPCCKRCGCIARPCRCEFDNEDDFFKYGEAFVQIEKP